MTVVILASLLALALICAIAVVRDVARDGHGRRPDIEGYDSRRPRP